MESSYFPRKPRWRLPAVLIGIALLAACGETSHDGDGGNSDGTGGGTTAVGGAGGEFATGGTDGLAGGSGSGGAAPFEGPCARDLVGDVVIPDQAYLDAIQDVCSIDGDLTIEAEVRRIELPWLKRVTGRVDMRFNSVLTEVAMSALESAGVADDDETGVRVGDVQNLTHLSLPALETAQLVVVFNAPALTEFDLPSLTRAKSLSIAAVGLEAFDLPVFAEGTINLNANPTLEALDAPSWTSGSLVVHDNESLSALTIPSLTSAQTIDLADNDALTSVSFPLLESMSGVLRLGHHSVLDEVLFPALTSTQGVSIVLEQALVSVSFPALETITDDWFEVTSNPVLEAISVPALVLEGNPQISNNPMLATCDGAALADVPDCP